MRERVEFLGTDLPGRIGTRQVRQAVGDIGRILHIEKREPGIESSRFARIKSLVRQKPPGRFGATLLDHGYVVQIRIEPFAVCLTNRGDEVVDLRTRLGIRHPGRRELPAFVECASLLPQLRGFRFLGRILRSASVEHRTQRHAGLVVLVRASQLNLSAGGNGDNQCRGDHRQFSSSFFRLSPLTKLSSKLDARAAQR